MRKDAPRTLSIVTREKGVLVYGSFPLSAFFSRQLERVHAPLTNRRSSSSGHANHPLSYGHTPRAHSGYYHPFLLMPLISYATS